MDRRQFNAVIASVVSLPLSMRAIAQRESGNGHTVLYNSVGDELTHYDVDIEAATLTRRTSLKMPSVVQYAWPHPSGRTLYVATSDGEQGVRTINGKMHRLCALRIDSTGELASRGEAQVLTERAIHTSVDRNGRYALTAYSLPPLVTVHHINADETLGPPVEQAADLDVGNFSHQILTLASNRTAVLVTRGINATATLPEEPGAIKVYDFRDGRLSKRADFTVGGHGGYGYGPRHLDFHPSKPWVYVLVERENQLHAHHLRGDDIEPVPAFIKPCTLNAPQQGILQVAGAIHVHPRGHVLYTSNRVSVSDNAETRQPMFHGGENSIVVFSIDQSTGEPTPIQFVDPVGYHVRTFSVDPSGRLLIAATMVPLMIQQSGEMRTVSAGLSVFRIAANGRLTFVRKYDVEVPRGQQQLWTRVMRLPA